MRKTVSFGAKPQTSAQTGAPAVDEWVGGVSETPESDAPRERMKRLTIDVPPSLHTRIKSQCALRGVNMADEIRALLERHFPDQDA